MKHLLLLVAGILAFPVFAQAQQTRLNDLSGAGYFQQEVHYEIRVKLDDVSHMLHAEESIRYINHAPVALKELWFHLWPNGYKNTETAFAKQQLANGSTKFQYASEENRGFIDSLDFKVNGEKVQFMEDPEHIDIARIILNKPLEPGAEIVISTPFRVKIPSSSFSRLGHSDQQYQLCQWYPKPAVYDSKGWHAFPYLNEGEFYSEFGSFRVAITTPSNYVIAASGDMEANPEEQQQIDENIRASEALVKAGPYKKLGAEKKVSSLDWKTVTYTLADVHDFAWFADKSYHILKSQVTLPNSGRVVETYCYFADKDAADWFAAPQYVNDAVFNYSKWLGDYPYKVCKAVDGALSAGAGMEYPTITIIASQGNPVALDNVIAHEVGHNWFYGILGSNERDYPWMDEGSNSYYEGRYMRLKYPKNSFLSSVIPGGKGEKLLHAQDFKPDAFQNLTYLFVARRNDDQSLALGSACFSNINYGAVVYQKTANIYNYLAASMGQERFDVMMQAYYENWKFKHPQPEDFKAHVEQFNGKKMPWLFDGLLASVDRVNYKICGFSTKGDAPYVTVRNVGQIAGPVSVSGIKGDSIMTKWFDGFEGKKRLPFPTGDFERYAVNAGNPMPDFNPKNDEMRSHGLFRKMGRVKVQLGTGIDHPRVSPIYVVPVMGANMYNGFMLGAAFHNIGILRKKIEYVIMPMYGFKNGELAGAAQVDYFIRPTNAFFRNLTLSGSVERYALRFAPNYDRVTAGATFEFKRRNVSTKKTSELNIRHVYIQSTPYLFSLDAPVVRTKNDFNQLTFTHKNGRAIHPYSFTIDAQQAKTFIKTSITANYRISYNKKGKGLDFRLFAGTFLWKSADYATGPDARFRLSGQNGSQDYLYNDIYFGRNETSGLWSQQMTMTDGGFKVGTSRGQTWDYLATLNVKTSLPGKLPLKLYADFGTYLNGETDRDELNYTAGAIISLIPENFEIYIPLLVSSKIQKSLDLNNINFGERIRFVINLRAYNPVRAVRALNF